MSAVAEEAAEAAGWPRRPTLVPVGGKASGVPRPRGEALLHERRHLEGSAGLSLLLVEDSAADGRLVLELLREAGVPWQLERVERVKEA